MKHKNREEYYKGEWVNGFKKGKGIFFIAGALAYFGEFDRVPHGRGKYVYIQPKMASEPTLGYYEFDGLVDH
jgi:hypothetical protein